MLPRLVPDHSPNRAAVYTETPCKLMLACPRDGETTNSTHVIVGQLGMNIAHAAWRVGTALCSAVLHVIGLCADKQVCRIATGTGIAGRTVVADIETCGDRAVESFIGVAMRQDGFASDPEGTVSRRHTRTQPQPAGIGIVSLGDLRHEAGPGVAGSTIRVLDRGDQMGGIDARAIAAGMTDVRPGGEGADERLIRVAVRLDPAVIDGEYAVPIVINGGSPQPTVAGRIDLRQESFLCGRRGINAGYVLNLLCRFEGCQPRAMAVAPGFLVA